MKVKNIFPLFVTAALLLAGNGLVGTLITLRGGAEGFSATTIGIIGSGYFAGFAIACLYAPRLIFLVGHIRLFAALAALVASSTLIMILAVDPFAWFISRIAMGFCFSGLFTIVESWLNEAAGNSERARLLSVYRLVDLSAVTGSQYILVIYDITNAAPFIITAIFFCLSLVPIALSTAAKPAPPQDLPFDLKAVWVISPLACVGSFSIGLTNGAFRIVGPLYGQTMGLEIVDVASFMSAGIVGGAVLQYPLGVMSDRLGRRLAIITATSGAVAAGIFLTLLASTYPWAPYVGAFLFGTFALPLYSLSAALANDHAGKGRFIIIAAGLTFFFAIGATLGPPVASALVDLYGPEFLFIYTSLIHGSLLIFTLFRITVRPELPAKARTAFVAMLRTSPAFFKLTDKFRHNDQHQNK